MSFSGHYWTIAPRVKAWVAPPRPPLERAWTTTVADLLRGAVPLTGRFADVPHAREAVLLVHGLGGSADSHYCRAASRAAVAAGVAALRLHLRGADRAGADFYHGGLTDDLHAALASPELARFERLYVLGFSLGGHVAIRLAAERADPRLVAVAALCAPLDLSVSRRALDARGGWLYRRHLLRGLKEIYAAVARRGPVPTPVERVRRIDSLLEWDAATVVPRFGFADPEDYYARVSAKGVLEGLRLPVLFAAPPDDPVVPRATVAPALAGAAPGLEVLWLPTGGHVGFPGRLRFADGRLRPVEDVLLDWLRAR